MLRLRRGKDADCVFAESDLTEKELDEAFASLKLNKSSGYDEINVNVVKKYFHILKTPLTFIFNLSLKSRNFPDALKRAKIVPIFKTGKKTNG